MDQSTADQSELFEGSESLAPRAYHKGKDELNFAEFPLTSLSTRAPNQKTLEFHDSIFDKRSGTMIDRHLTVTASDKYGLPTAQDDEIVLALIQLSHHHGFTKRTVPFSAYEIIRVLGWNEGARSYQRVRESLDRWVGVTLKYENAWWDPQDKKWMNETFHILDRLTSTSDGSDHDRNAFVWSEVIFESFQKGYLKSIDLKAYRSLKSHIAKRLYRLLDKRFHFRQHVESDVMDLARNKLGLSKNYALPEIKRKLAVPIQQLEAIGFIKSAAQAERFVKIRAGVWNVVFDKQSPNQDLPLELPTGSALDARMIKLGVSPKKARHLIATHPDAEDYLDLQTQRVEYLMTQEGREPDNPGGYLVQAIEQRWGAPTGFKSKAERDQTEREIKARTAKREAEKLAVELAQQTEEQRIDSEAAKRRLLVEDFLSTLPDDERAVIERESYQHGCKTMGKQMMDGDGPFGDMSRRTALEEYVINELIPTQPQVAATT